MTTNYHTYYIIFLISFASRLLISFVYGDHSLQNEWEILVRNLIEHNTLAMINFGDLYVPNLWMPPLYAYFLFLISIFFESLNNTYINTVLITQCLLSSITIIIFYEILKNFYNNNISLIGAIVFSFFPLNVYSAVQISSASIVMFLSMFFYYFLIKFTEDKKINYLILFSITAGLLILSRREFVLLFIITNLFLFFFIKVNLKKIFLILLLTSLVISPYIVRNYIAFNKIIIQAGFGYNVWKAYNPMAKVEGYLLPSEDLNRKISSVKQDKFYRINEDRLYLKQAIRYIQDEPIKYLKLYFLRLFSYYFIDFDSSQKNYYNFFHIAPNILISIFFLFSLFRYNKKSIILNYFLFIFFTYLFLISSFAVLPRYKLYIIPIQILFSLNLLSKKN